MRNLKYAFAIGVGTALASPAIALDIMPGDYTVLPSGTSALLVYGQFTKADSLELDIGDGFDVPSSELGTTVGLLRYLHYTEIGGTPVGFQAILPFGRVSSYQVGGADMPTENGLGDLVLGVTAWPVHSADPTGTTIGVTAYLTLPTGAYELGSASVGTGTWTLTPQIGIIQGLGNGFFVDGALDVAIQRDHDENGFEVSRDPSTQLQAYLRYQYSPTTNVSFGYSGTFGGDDEVDGVYAGTKTRTDELRLVGSTFLNPTTQLTGMIGTQVKAEGGFKRDVIGTVRLMKLF